jgi:hypothetical protein
MKFPYLQKGTRSWHNQAALHILVLFILLTLASCSSILGEDESAQNTKTALGVQQTQLAEQIKTNTAAAEESSSMATEIVQGTPASVEGSTVPPVEQTPVTPMPEATEPMDLVAQMASAKILLYENMSGYPDTNRYVKDTLDSMGLTYVDTGSRKGDLKSQLTNGGPDGAGWDLIIVASEARPTFAEEPGISGEYFDLLNEALDQGSSVILEAWYLDKVAGGGSTSALLDRCGVEFEANWDNVDPENLVMFVYDPSHPILLEPNSDLTFTKVTSFWYDPFTDDIGDWMRLSSASDAKLVVGRMTEDPTRRGTITVCIDGRMILQTFSSHTLTYNSMKPLWENYIYNALKTRFQ